MDAASLSRLTVSQLKAKCKELKVVGYSKLAKPALIEKLAALECAAGGDGSGVNTLGIVVPNQVLPILVAPSVPTEAGPPYQVVPQAAMQETTQPSSELTQNDPDGTKKATKKRPRKNEGESAPKRPKKGAVTGGSQSQPLNDDLLQQDAPTVPPKTAPGPSPSALSDVSQRVFQVPRLPARLSQALDVSTTDNGSAGTTSRPDPSVLAPATRQPASSATSDTGSKKADNSSTRPVTSTIKTSFKPLPPLPIRLTNTTRTIAKPVPVPKTTASTRLQLYTPKTFKSPAVVCPPRANPSSKPQTPIHIEHSPSPRLTNQCLDLPAPPRCTDFPRITMPPSMSRRRQAERMSVVFSGISDRSVLALCVQMSHAWRYAVYLSATHTLLRNFPGSRLDTVLASIKEPRMTSMWAYLRVRQDEVETRRKNFDESWLGRCFKPGIQNKAPGLFSCTRDPISSHLWTSPDDELQIVVALRFVSTRLVFALARRHDSILPAQEWLGGVVVGADEVVPNEIWRVTTVQTLNTEGAQCNPLQTKTESFHVLFDTGEVIGHAPPPSRNPGSMFGQRISRGRPHLEVFDESSSSEKSLRTDWARYIEACERGDVPCLQDAITSADRESYVAGVSAFWLRRLGTGAGAEDDGLLRTIARRYVLSCVEPNSVSGGYKTVTGMARELAGGRVDQTAPVKYQRLGLLISGHHLVDSVHLKPGRNKANTQLHPALALVHTAPGREYFVLRDTGMAIGTSDEGLEPLWQEIMGCDTWGCVST